MRVKTTHMKTTLDDGPLNDSVGRCQRVVKADHSSGQY